MKITKLVNHTNLGFAKRACKQSVVAALGLLSLAIHPVAGAQTNDQNTAIAKGVAVAAADSAERSSAELAKDLQNPVADMISVPVESRLDFAAGNSTRLTINLQPVVPFKLSEQWNVVSRTIVPFNCQQAPAGEPDLDNPSESPVKKGPKLFGIGDLTQSFFFAPKDPTHGWIWGAGPVFRLPTASQSVFGDGMWGAGPTAVGLRQDGPWSYGMLANHIWSFAGWGPQSVSMTYLQPFLNYTTDSQTTFGLSSETGYAWTDGQWVVPVDLSVSQLVEIGKLPLSIGLSGRLYAERPNGGPNWGLTLTFTFVFPK